MSIFDPTIFDSAIFDAGAAASADGGGYYIRRRRPLREEDDEPRDAIRQLIEAKFREVTAPIPSDQPLSPVVIVAEIRAAPEVAPLLEIDADRISRAIYQQVAELLEQQEEEEALMMLLAA